MSRWRLRRIRHGIALRTGPRRGIAFTWRPLRIWNDLREEHAPDMPAPPPG